MAHQLHMTVHQLRTQMSNEEFVRWSRWFARKAQRQQLEQTTGGKP